MSGCNNLHRGQGSVLIRALDANAQPGAIIGAGWQTVFTTAWEEVNTEDQREDYTGSMGLICHTNEGIDGVVTITGKDWKMNNLARGLFGIHSKIDAETAATHTAPDGLAQNDIYVIPEALNPTITQIQDSEGTPATLVEDTDYQLLTANSDGGVLHGGVKFISDLATFTQPFVFTYDDIAHDNLPMFTSQQGTPVWIEFHGVNAQNNDQEKIQLFRVQPQPFTDTPFISKTPGELTLEGRLLVDVTRKDVANFGPFGSFKRFPAAA